MAKRTERPRPAPSRLDIPLLEEEVMAMAAANHDRRIATLAKRERAAAARSLEEKRR